MSRVFGKSYEVYCIAKELNEAKLPKYKRDNTECSWDTIETLPERLEIYLPNKAIEFLSSKKIKILRTPFLKYTLTQIPDNDDEDCFIKFPSLLPKEEFKRELMFYIGMLLSSYNNDSTDEDYGIPNEYDDVLPLLLEYIYLKHAKRTDEFSIKHLNELKSFNKTYPTFYEDYQDFQILEKQVSFSVLDEDKLEKFDRLCVEKKSEITSLTNDSVILLSSFDGALSLIDQVKTEAEMKQVIEALMLNEKENRGQILRERNIDSYGYKRLRKEIDTFRKK